MRLISQDRKIDIPYKNSAVYIVANYGHSKENGFHNIVGYEIMANTGNYYWNLGDYSTEEKALQVTEMIRHHHQQLIDFDYSAIKGIIDRPSIYFYMPQDNEVTEKSVYIDNL